MKKLLAILTCAAAAAWSGCSSNNAAPAATPNEAPAFVWFDDGTPRSVHCPAARLTRTADGRLKVDARLQNKDYTRIEVQVNCVFMDGQGFTTDETPFRTLILDESSAQDVTFESFNTNAVRYLVRVRKSR